MNIQAVSSLGCSVSAAVCECINTRNSFIARACNIRVLTAVRSRGVRVIERSSHGAVHFPRSIGRVLVVVETQTSSPKSERLCLGIQTVLFIYKTLFCSRKLKKSLLRTEATEGSG